MTVRLPVVDRGETDITATRHPGNGFYYVSGTLTRPGIFRYQTDGGQWINAVRFLEDVAGSDFVATVNGSALMLDHPSKILVEPGDPLDGMFFSAVADAAGQVQVEAWITSAEAIQAYDSGVRKLSACFIPDWLPMNSADIAKARYLFPEDAKVCTDGRWMRHSNLICNHGAIVGEGRVSGAALDSAASTLLLNMETTTMEEEAETITAVADACDDAPMAGGEVSIEIPAEDMAPEMTIAELAKAMVGMAMRIAAAAKGHGMTMDSAEVVADSAAAHVRVINHFGATVPSELDNDLGRAQVAELLLSQKPQVVADAAAEEVPEVVADAAEEEIPERPKTETLHETLQRINAAANKV